MWNSGRFGTSFVGLQCSPQFSRQVAASHPTCRESLQLRYGPCFPSLYPHILPINCFWHSWMFLWRLAWTSYCEPIFRVFLKTFSFFLPSLLLRFPSSLLWHLFFLPPYSLNSTLLSRWLSDAPFVAGNPSSIFSFLHHQTKPTKTMLLTQ